MAGHSRSKNGVALLAYDPAIHAFLSFDKAWMPATSAGMTWRLGRGPLRKNPFSVDEMRAARLGAAQ
jgi:hypothetical protein